MFPLSLSLLWLHRHKQHIHMKKHFILLLTHYNIIQVRVENIVYFSMYICIYFVTQFTLTFIRVYLCICMKLFIFLFYHACICCGISLLILIVNKCTHLQHESFDNFAYTHILSHLNRNIENAHILCYKLISCRGAVVYMCI